MSFFRWRTFIQIIGLVCLLGNSLLAYALLEPYLIEIKRIPWHDPNIPPAFDGMRLVFVTDIHHGPNFPLWRLRRLVKSINALQPDMVLFGGDYYQWGEEYVLPCFQELQHIEAPLGKFGVFGNHDHWKDWIPLAEEGMRLAGITSLENQAQWIEQDGQRIKLGGVGDLTHGTQDLGPTLAQAQDDDFVLLLTHNPEYVEQLSTSAIDLVLSGHTHAGQITVFGLWAPFLDLQYGRKYLKGIVKTDDTTVIISHGVGMVAVPLRVCARPDILVLTLKAE